MIAQLLLALLAVYALMAVVTGVLLHVFAGEYFERSRRDLYALALAWWVVWAWFVVLALGALWRKAEAHYRSWQRG